MKKIFISILLFLPLTYGNAQSVLTPQQQLEQAQKQLEEAKKAVEEAKKAAEEAKKRAAEEAAKKQAAEEAKKRAAEEAAKKQAAEEAKKKAAEEAAKKQAAEAKAQAEKIQQQIREAEAEAARLKAEAARLNAIANGEATAMPTTKQTPATSTATKNTEKPASKTSGWVIPTAVKKNTEETKPATTAAGLKLKEDPKYLEGAVTTDENGKVVFEAEMEAPGKSAEQLYELLFDYMSGLTQDKEAIESRIALVNKDEHIIANLMDEWLVFNSSFISLDRTECKYNLIANISDGKIKMTINHINYTYEEGRQTGFKLPAEEVITDKVALTKKKNDLARIFGKFRKKTIDRKDQIFNEIVALIK